MIFAIGLENSEGKINSVPHTQTKSLE